MKSLIAIILAAGAGANLLVANPDIPLFDSRGGQMIVFPGDSLDLSQATFTIDGDTVDRDIFFHLDRRDIQTLTVTPAPANLIEVVTRRAAQQPLEPEELPEDIDYVVDGTIVDRAAFTAIPPRAITSMAIVKGERPRIEITTKRGPRHTSVQ